MDERQKRLLTSLVAGSALSLTLGVTASATELGALEQTPDTSSEIQSDTSQSPAPANAGGSNEGGSTNEGDANKDGGTTNEGGETGALLGQETTNAQPGQTAADSPMLLAEDGEAASERKTVVTEGENEYDLADEASASAGWNADSKSGWRYDGTSISMINNGNALEIHAEGTGVDLSVAGVNRISTLYADADVNITGTGIVLIDSIDMLEGTNLNLLTNTEMHSEGSAAVFLLNPETGSYELINGSVVGILDEEYTIPDGVTLVVPDGGKLDMRIVTQVGYYETDPETGECLTKYRYEIINSDLKKNEYGEGGYYFKLDENNLDHRTIAFKVPQLTIGQGASLNILQGAQMRAQSFWESITGTYHRSTLVVEGGLALDGTISSLGAQNCTTGEFLLELKNTGSVTGSGSLSQAGVIYQGDASSEDSSGDTLNFAGSGNYVDLRGSGDLNIVANGQTDIYYTDGMSISSVKANKAVTFYVKKERSDVKDIVTDRLDIRDSLTGSYSVGSGYVRVDGRHANENFQNTGRDQNGNIRAQATELGRENLNSFFTTNWYGSNTGIPYCENGSTGGYLHWQTMEAVGTTDFSFSGLNKAFGKTISGILEPADYALFEVFSYENGCVKLYLVGPDKTEWLSTNDPSKVFLIRGVTAYGNPCPELGQETGVQSGTSNTGSGILGGSNAGSFTGSNATGVLGGKRQPAVPPVTPETPETPQEASQPDAPKQENSKYDFVLKVTGSGTEYDLKAFYDGIELKELGGGTVTVELEAQLNPGWNPMDVFAVFRDAQGKLVAVRVRYDERTGKLAFDTPMLGQFRLVYLDWDGTDYTDEAFLAAIAACLK